MHLAHAATYLLLLRATLRRLHARRVAHVLALLVFLIRARLLLVLLVLQILTPIFLVLLTLLALAPAVLLPVSVGNAGQGALHLLRRPHLPLLLATSRLLAAPLLHVGVLALLQRPVDHDGPAADLASGHGANGLGCVAPEAELDKAKPAGELLPLLALCSCRERGKVRHRA